MCASSLETMSAMGGRLTNDTVYPNKTASIATRLSNNLFRYDLQNMYGDGSIKS